MWSITHDDTDVLIASPGELAIILRDFDPALVERDELPPEALGSLLQRQWRYPLEDGVWLEGLSTGDTAALDRPELHRLHIGSCVQCTIPEELAEVLHALMAGTVLYEDVWDKGDHVC